MAVSKLAVNAYVNPAWGVYNQGLTRLVEDGNAELKIAEGCGHFIQKDNPVLVATELNHLLDSLDV